MIPARVTSSVYGEKGIEVGDKPFFPSHQPDHCGDIMRDVKRIVPGVPFDEALPVSA
jgi:hypothetical protein